MLNVRRAFETGGCLELSQRSNQMYSGWVGDMIESFRNHIKLTFTILNDKIT